MSTTTVQKFYCGEVFITNTYCMVLECKCCNEEFGVYSTFLDHIFEKHFDDWAATEKSKNDRKKCTTPKEKLSEQVLLPTEGNERITIESKTSNELAYEGDEDLITEILEPLENDIADMEDDIIENEQLTKASIMSVRPVRVFPTKPLKNDAERKYKCKICGFAVAGIYNLRGHEQRHSNIKPFTCLKCNKAFYTSTELKIHTRRHNGEKPYVCTYCGKCFITTGTLNKHEKQHVDDRPHKCDQCEKRFNNAYQLRQHAVVHTQERNFSCEKCQAKFTRKKTLQTHMKLHDNALEYECIICHMRFNQRPTLLWHIKNKHNVLREDSEGKISSEFNVNS